MEVDPDRPVLVDKYLDRADELDVDALCDKDGHVTICGIMQHIEQAGVHSGEQTCHDSCATQGKGTKACNLGMCQDLSRHHLYHHAAHLMQASPCSIQHYLHIARP